MNNLDTSEPAPLWLWYGIKGGVVLLTLIMVAVVVMLALGIADPPRAKTLILEDNTEYLYELAPHETLALTDWQAIPAGRFTLELDFIVDGDPSAVWGVWVDEVVVTFNTEGSMGYVSARECPSIYTIFEDCYALTEPSQKILMTWKESLFLQDHQNQIQLHYEPQRGVMSLRINHEWMWDIPLSETANPREWGLWLQGGRDTTTTTRIKLQRVRLWGG